MTMPAAAWLLARANAAAARLDRLGPLPAPLAQGQARIARVVRGWPSAPPSVLAAALINRELWPRLQPEVRAGLSGRVIALEVSDLGLRFRLLAHEHGFVAAGERAAAALRIAARAAGWWRLARGLEDPDRLFFDRTLVMEGDTELGLLLKNGLDALGPLWPGAPAR